MEIKDTEKYRIITPLCQKITQREAERLIDEITNTNKEVGVDLSLVQDCTYDFINIIYHRKKISFFNIHSDILAIFLSFNIDKLAKLYVSEFDFIHNKHQLLNRKFNVI